ncbi:lanthionine synthetase LanC family protein, partial [Kitasatospora sp. NPDC001574]
MNSHWYGKIGDGPAARRVAQLLILALVADRYWRVRPLGADLAGGYTGAALFLAQLAALTGSDRYAEVARQALSPVPGLLESLAAHPDLPAAVGSGGFAGLGGIAYALWESAVAEGGRCALITEFTALSLR